MKLEKEKTYNLSEFEATETGHARHKASGTIAEFDGKPAFLFSHAPDSASPNQPFIKKSGEVGFYSANGKKLGASVGERAPRKANFTIPVSIFAPNNNNPFVAAASDKDEDKKTALLKNSQTILALFGADTEIEVPGRAACKEHVEWDDENDEFVAFAQKAGVKKSDIKGMMKLRGQHPTKEIDVPAVPAGKTTLRQQFKSLGANGKVDLTMQQALELRNRAAAMVLDAVRIVSDAAEGERDD
jgi:hypothetical protein